MIFVFLYIITWTAFITAGFMFGKAIGFIIIGFFGLTTMLVLAVGQKIADEEKTKTPLVGQIQRPTPRSSTGTPGMH